ncbi:FAD-dependent monooxygenase [Pararoseomonas indoligenes]|uniref:FAD-dependent monooxygenase n=1 Tax=Roseomonas indoligenes TaxID=2820811 RepID=A0A940MWX2_9PROT|nr:FAD-dependent monooxygenase [Pararoseomonas indoligenes]MBP0492324.1 FAD-dependent monooxygenase [Pararoseomonas indoligenes]
MAQGEDRTQVVIVGGGPVGTGLAIALAQRGIEAVLVERYRTPQPIPKGQNLTQRTMEHFHFWGAEKALRAARTIPREYGIGGMTAYGTLLGDYHYDWLQRELVRPYYFTDNERLPQYATEAVLRARLAELSTAKALYGWSAEGVEQDGDGVRVTVSERESGATRVISADYVVGCDGSRSTVREAVGITQTRSDHDRLMVLLVFRSQGLNELLRRYPGKSYYNVLHPDLQGYWQFFGRVDLEGSFFFHAPVPAGTTKDSMDFAAYLHRAAGAEFDVQFEHIGFWDLRFAIADRYRAGRAFVAGDAAHSHPPYGGYGINTGLEDAANLAWKLAADLQGWAGPGLLDSYDAERRPVFASTAGDFIGRSIELDRDFLAAFDPTRDRAAFEAEWAARQGGAKSEVASFEPNYEGSPIIPGPAGRGPSALGSHSPLARPGHHLTPQHLADGRNCFEALGPGFTLLAPDPGAAAAMRDDAARRGIPLEVAAIGAEAQKTYGAEAVLVRPDQFVAWAGPTAEASGALERATGG